MKQLTLPAIALAISALMFISPARADLLIGVKGGIQALDFEDFELLGQTDTSLIAGVQMGYEFKPLSIELEISSSLDKGEVLNREFNLQNSALYFSLRGQGARYFIGKLGFVQTEVDFVDYPNLDDTGTAVSIGMGFGKDVGMELELTGYSYEEMGQSAMLTAGWSF
jgi:hypothetical protein